MKSLTVTDVCNIYKEVGELFEAQGKKRRYRILRVLANGKETEYYNTTEPVRKDGMLSFYGNLINEFSTEYIKIRGGIITYSTQVIRK